MKKIISFVTIMFFLGTILSGCADIPKQSNAKTNVIIEEKDNITNDTINKNTDNTTNNDIKNEQESITNKVKENKVEEDIKIAEKNEEKTSINNSIKDSITNNINLKNNVNINTSNTDTENVVQDKNSILNNTNNDDILSADTENVDLSNDNPGQVEVNEILQEKTELIDSLVVAKYGVTEEDIQKHKNVMYKLSLNLLHLLKDYNIVIILLPPNDDLSSYLNNRYDTDEYEVDKYSGIIYYNERIIFVQSKFSGKTTLHEIGHFFDYVDCYKKGYSNDKIIRKTETSNFRDLVVSEDYNSGRLEDYCKEDVLNYYKKGAYALSNLNEFYAESFARYFYYDSWYNSYEYDMPEIYNYFNNLHNQGII